MAKNNKGNVNKKVVYRKSPKEIVGLTGDQQKFNTTVFTNTDLQESIGKTLEEQKAAKIEAAKSAEGGAEIVEQELKAAEEKPQPVPTIRERMAQGNPFATLTVEETSKALELLRATGPLFVELLSLDEADVSIETAGPIVKRMKEVINSFEIDESHPFFGHIDPLKTMKDEIDADDLARIKQLFAEKEQMIAFFGMMSTLPDLAKTQENINEMSSMEREAFVEGCLEITQGAEKLGYKLSAKETFDMKVLEVTRGVVTPERALEIVAEDAILQDDDKRKALDDESYAIMVQDAIWFDDLEPIVKAYHEAITKKEPAVAAK